MKLLAIETATEACSVAVLDGDRLYQRHALMPRRHAEQVLPWAEQLLDEAGIARQQLDAVAVGRGPGGFTGVRLAVAVAQGIAYALQIPLLPVSSLAALAMQAEAEADTTVLAAIDARMGELYLGLFQVEGDGLVRPLRAEWMATAAEPSDLGTMSVCGVGSGFAAADAALVAHLGPRLLRYQVEAYPRAAAVARLAARDYAAGRRPEPATVEPAYLRDKVAQTLAERGVK